MSPGASAKERERIDSKEILSQEDFVKLRDWRAEEAGDGAMFSI